MGERICRYVREAHREGHSPPRRTREEAELLLEMLIEWHQDGSGLEHHCEGCVLVAEIVRLRRLVEWQPT